MIMTSWHTMQTPLPTSNSKCLSDSRKSKVSTPVPISIWEVMKIFREKLQYFDPELNESYTPYVIETSIGVDRMFLSIMAAAYCEEKLENGESRVVLKLPAPLAR